MAQTNGRNRGCHSGCFQPSGMNKPAEFATETKSRRLQRESPVATFLELNAPAQIARSVRQGGKNNEFCYRHNPSNPQCRQRLANEPLIGDIQAVPILCDSGKSDRAVSGQPTFFRSRSHNTYLVLLFCSKSDPETIGSSRYFDSVLLPPTLVYRFLYARSHPN